MIDAEAQDVARRRLWALLGAAPLPSAPSATRLANETCAAYVLERWRLDLAGESAPALLTLPRDRPPRAVVLYHHAHGFRFDIGKDELVAGRPALLSPPYADALAARGYAALAIDHRGFGERAVPSESTRTKLGLWHGEPLLGQRIADAVAATAWIAAHPTLGALPRVAFGFSMGSTIAWWSAALDPRIDAVVEACCLAEFAALESTGAVDLHGEYFFVPGLLRDWTAATINALVLPRPHLSIVGRDDPLTPPAAVASIDAAMRAASASAGVPGAWRQSVHPSGHEETPAMRNEVLAFVDALAA